ncbi:myo-inositol 2-dehydrogenase-like [Saccostrea echinata]|uniref:myo-inositol 2-dehydrogenase-like n=1 Tax=Saccostrea echinata TaxID=191078 RepID=UPI002A82BF50|nr:myo-inositol 2-dehydrogenase-like [Saccostrea echinata]
MARRFDGNIKRRKRSIRAMKYKARKNRKFYSNVLYAREHVFNLTKNKLTDSEYFLLAKGLKFIPTPSTKVAKNDLLKDFDELARKMRWKHVFAEKPLALTEEEVANCYRAAKTNNKTLQCGFDKRFDVSIQKLYEKIRCGDLGTLRTIKLSARELPSTCTKEYILSSGGFLTDSAIHEFDLLVWLAGERPQSVFSFGHAHNPMIKECGDFDSVNVVLKFPSGLLAFIENFRGVSYGYDQRYEVLGTKGCAVIENPKESQLCLWDEKGMHSDLMWQQALTRFTDAYRKEIEHFAAVIKGEIDCIVKGEEVTYVSRLCASATESLQQGKVINLT